MKRAITRLAMGMLLGATTALADAEWLTDFEAAKASAAEREVPILVNFSGSDWCGWCIKLDKEVLEKADFTTFAADHLVLFNADFPRRTELPEALTAQNEKLAEQYALRGFPTILLLDADGTELARTGYRPGGPEAYVEHLQALLGQAR